MVGAVGVVWVCGGDVVGGAIEVGGDVVGDTEVVDDEAGIEGEAEVPFTAADECAGGLPLCLVELACAPQAAAAIPRRNTSANLLSFFDNGPPQS